MDHNDIRHKLSEYLDGSVTPDERTAIEAHLPTCAECSDALRELRKTIEHLHAVEEVQPPAWMTSKIMAKVREERDKRSGISNILFDYFIGGRAIRVAAVLFLTVTAYYIYTSMHPAEKYAEEPMQRLVKEEARPAAPERKEPELSAQKEKKQDQSPGYKSLDMKYSYEKPASPAPVEAPIVAAPAKQAAPLPARDEAAREARSAAPRAAAPSIMAEQAAPAEGTVRPSDREMLRAPQAGGSPAGDLEAEALLAVTEQFARHDLPQNMKVKGLRYAARKFERGLADLAWMERTAAFRSSPCNDRYVVDVDLSGSLSKYLYCHESSRAKLIGTYELRNGKWTEIR